MKENFFELRFRKIEMEFQKIQLLFNKFRKQFLNFQLGTVEYSDDFIWKFLRLATRKILPFR